MTAPPSLGARARLQSFFRPRGRYQSRFFSDAHCIGQRTEGPRRNAAVEMIPRGRSRVTRVLVAVAAASFVLLFTGVVSWTRDETSGPIASAFASVIRGAFFASALALAAVVAWRRRQANRDASNGSGGGSDKGAHQRWDGSRWVDVESQSQAVPSAVNTKTTNGFGGGDGRDTSASVQRPPGPSSYDPTTPYADDASTSIGGASLNGEGTYQGNETPEEARRRLHREQQDAAYWARVEREDEERERREEEREEALLERERERRAAKKEKRREQRAEAKAEKMREKASSKSDKWARHEARWNALEATVTTTVTMGTDGSGSEESAPLRYDDVPWPPKMSAMLRHACDGGGDKERKLAYHRLLRRWHPDKFGARYGTRVAAGGDGDRVMERVNAVARALNQEFARRS